MYSECAHILPFSIHKKVVALFFRSQICVLIRVAQTPVQTALEVFAPGFIHASNIAQNINHPCNAINMVLDVHRAFDDLYWGIEAILDDGVVHIPPLLFISCYLSIPQIGQPRYRYYYRIIKENWSHPLVRLSDGDELLFGSGGGLANTEYLPNPGYCNIKLAIGRVLQACGAAEMIDYLFHKDEESRQEGASYLDGSPVMLDLLDNLLHQVAV